MPMSTNRWCGDGGVVEFQIARIEDVVGIHLAGSPRRFRPVVPVHFSHHPCAPCAPLPSYQTPPLLRANRDGTHHSQGVKVPMPWSPVPIRFVHTLRRDLRHFPFRGGISTSFRSAGSRKLDRLGTPARRGVAQAPLDYPRGTHLWQRLKAPGARTWKVFGH